MCVRGLHLAVLHGQQGALDSLTRVLAALPPGDRLLDMRNHLYQVRPHHSMSLHIQTTENSGRQLL